MMETVAGLNVRAFLLRTAHLTYASTSVMNPDRNVDLAVSTTTGGGATRRARPDENDIFNGRYDRLRSSWMLLT